MPIYISLLRGVNLGPYNRMKMEDLKKSCETLGFGQIKTYVQSGNVIFKAAKQSTSGLSAKLKEKILADFGYTVPVLTKTAEEIEKAIRNNPFLKENGIDTSKLHVSFLWEAPSAASLKKLGELPAKPDQFRHHGCEIYLYCPNGYGKTKLSNNILERVLSVGVTTRNWKTVNSLHEMAQDYS
jgi:uncharacterized protein (DUF1697 family)